MNWLKRCATCWPASDRARSHVPAQLRLPHVALVITVVAVAVLMIAPRVGAEESPTVHWIADLNAPAIEVPEAWAATAGPVIWCESKFNPAAVGAAGERGALQIHPIHEAGMRRQGLDWRNSEVDRTRYAIQMWERSGWQPAWSCAKKLGVK